MSGTKKGVDLTPEFLSTFLATLGDECEKEVVQHIVTRFVDGGLPAKVKQYNQACMAGTYRILCFIKKSTEAVIINNKGMGREGMSIQVRLDDRSVFDDLDSLSPGIREQILGAGDCGHCSAKCEGKKYMFAYQGREYIKCYFLCNTFCFQHLESEDVGCLMGLIGNEIAWAGRTQKEGA